MRLLSFLTAIEKALVAESPALDGGAWDSSRMISFHRGLARLTLAPRPGNDGPQGGLLLQEFELADGSLCLKAGLSWQGSEASAVVAVYSTPQLNWKLEASRIAGAWLAGPADVQAFSARDEALQPLAAMAG
ncbi:MAG: hypothetical protein RLZZ15_4414 [Verrucomicrobiota bacterium]|jgi:hypothetical protein